MLSWLVDSSLNVYGFSPGDSPEPEPPNRKIPEPKIPTVICGLAPFPIILDPRAVPPLSQRPNPSKGRCPPTDSNPEIMTLLVDDSAAFQPRRFVVGDVHGHYETLLRLLDVMSPGVDDAVHFVGDLIDRGPDSAKVLQLLQQEGYKTLVGNHEQLLMQAIVNLKDLEDDDFNPWLYSGGWETLASYNGDWERIAEDVQWIKQQPYYCDWGDFWLVHAGVNPRYLVNQQLDHDLCWIRDDFHRMRTPYFTDKTIITGHTITFTFPGVEPGNVVQGQGWLDIDTGVYHPRSGWLTALDLDNQCLYQANSYSQETRILALSDGVQAYQPKLRRNSLHACA